MGDGEDDLWVDVGLGHHGYFCHPGMMAFHYLDILDWYPHTPDSCMTGHVNVFYQAPNHSPQNPPVFLGGHDHTSRTQFPDLCQALRGLSDSWKGTWNAKASAPLHLHPHTRASSHISLGCSRVQSLADVLQAV